MINSVSYNAKSSYTNTKSQNTSINGGVNKEIQALQKQKLQIENQIEKIRTGTAEQKIKEQLIQPLKDQIEQIESEISEKQMEEIKKSQNSDTNKETTSSSSKNDENKNNHSDELLLDNANDYNNIKNISSVKKALKGEARVLRTEADADQARGNIQVAAKKRTKARKNELHANNIDSKIYKVDNNINKNNPNTDSIKNGGTQSNKDTEINEKQQSEKVHTSNGFSSKKTSKDDSSVDNITEQSTKVSIDTLV